MPVNYTPPTPEQLLPVGGVALGSAAAGIKRWTRDDVLLIELAAGSRKSQACSRRTVFAPHP